MAPEDRSPNLRWQNTPVNLLPLPDKQIYILDIPKCLLALKLYEPQVRNSKERL